MDPAIIGAGIQTIGGLLAPKNPSPKKQAYGSLMGAFKAADEAGLHRLTVAGSPAGYSPAPSAAAEGLMAAGQTVAGMSGSKKQDQLIDAQIEEARSRTALNEANTRRALAGPQPGLGGFQPRIGRGTDMVHRVGWDEAADGSDRPVMVEPERDVPATQTVTMRDGTGRGPNPDAFEIGISELIAGALIYGPQWLNNRLDRATGGSTERQRRLEELSNPPATGPARR